MKPRKVPARLAPKPPSPVPSSQPKLWKAPSAQPERMSGKVSQLGTLSFQPSMMAAAIMATQMNHRGQFARMKDMGEGTSDSGNHVCSRGERGKPRRLGRRGLLGADRRETRFGQFVGSTL